LVKIVADYCEVYSSPSHVLMRARPNDQYQYAPELTVTASAAVAFFQASSEAALLWKGRYCHLGTCNLRLFSTLVLGMDALRSADIGHALGAICHPCVLVRLHAATFHPTLDTTSTLELVQMDLVGPLPPPLGKACHIFTFLHDATELALALPSLAKSDAGQAVRF